MAQMKVTKPSTKKKPVKAGSSSRPHGGAPTGKIVKVRTKILTEVKKK